MPLPAALLARLAKRGIVNTGKVKGTWLIVTLFVKTWFVTDFCVYLLEIILEPEETFAEDYSEKDDSVNPDSYEYQGRKRDDNIWMEKVKRRFKETTKGVKGCPNKWNVFHSAWNWCLHFILMLIPLRFSLHSILSWAMGRRPS